MQLQEKLLAGHLRRQQPLGRVGQLIRREKPWPRRHHGGEVPTQIVDAVAAAARKS